MRDAYFDRFPAEAGLTPQWLHPYRAARVVADGITIGWFGQLYPREARKRANWVTRCSLGNCTSTASTSCRCAGPSLARFRVTSRCAATFLSLSKTAPSGRRLIARSMSFSDSRVGGMEGKGSVPRRAPRHRRAIPAAAGRYVSGALDRTLREEELQSFQAQVVEAVGKAGARLRA